MASPFLGQIKIFAGNFAPRGYALCNGQILPISQNNALFALLGTTFGGNGQTTFALPDLQGRVPMHFGQGGGLSVQVLGAKGGTESEALTLAQLPSHTHGAATIPASSQPATKTDPAGCVFAVPNNGGFAYQTAANASLGGGVSLSVGSNQPHSNLQPYLCLNFIIALQGVFPSRN